MMIGSATSKVLLRVIPQVVAAFTCLVLIERYAESVLLEPVPDASDGTATQAHALATPPPGIRTVFLILFENKDWTDILGSPSAPYINSILPMASYCEEYYNPPNQHPSLRNYIWLEAGSNLGITNNNSPGSNHQSTTNHLATRLLAAGVSWRSYQEGILGTNCPTRVIPATHYSPHHNPNVYFDDIISNAQYCISHNRPYEELAGDLQSNTVARYNFITPNQCNDGHNLCPPVNDKVRQLDNWLSGNIPMILDSQPYQEGGAIFIAFDEGSMSDGPLPMIVLSPLAKGNGYSNTIHYTHSSMLRTMQTLFGVGPFLRGATNAVDLRDLFIPAAFQPAAIGVSPDSINVGSVSTGSTVTATFAVTNTGALTLNGRATATGPLTMVSGSSFSLAAADTTNTTVSFVVQDAGPFAYDVIFQSNGGQSTNTISGIGQTSDLFADFSGMPRNGASPLQVTFTDTSTGTINNRLWHFGDGATLVTTSNNLSHTYTAVGQYSVRLTVSGPSGSSTTNRLDYISVTSPSLPTVTISASDAVAKEPGGNTGTFTVNRVGGLNNALTVSYDVTGKATGGSDYAALPGTVTLAVNATDATIRVTPLDDNFLECPETVVVTLSTNAAYEIGAPSQATVTIKDNELPVVTITASDPSASEQSSDKGTFMVTRTGCTNAALAVAFLVSGTATPATDYANIGTTVSIQPGKTSAVLAVKPIDDTSPETPETVIVTLASKPVYQLGSPKAATVTIADND